MDYNKHITHSHRGNPEECAGTSLYGQKLILPQEDISLIECLFWQGSTYRYLEKHVRRLQCSALYFRHPFDASEMVRLLEEQSGTLEASQAYKVRLLLMAQGRMTVEASNITLPSFPEVVPQVILSSLPTNSQHWQYYHKTTQRPLYEAASAFARSHQYADVIFLNERQEITEGAISNIFIQRGQRLLTPPVHCGLLNGIYREHLLETCHDISEAIIRVEDILAAEHVYISNAIRGLREVTFCHGTDNFILPHAMEGKSE